MPIKISPKLNTNFILPIKFADLEKNNLFLWYFNIVWLFDIFFLIKLAKDCQIVMEFKPILLSIPRR